MMSSAAGLLLFIAVLAASNGAEDLGQDYDLAPAADIEGLCQLPDDVLGRILNLIGDPKHLVSVCMVNRRFHDLTQLPLRLMALMRDPQFDANQFSEWIRHQEFLLRFPDLPNSISQSIVDCLKDFQSGKYDAVLQDDFHLSCCVAYFDNVNEDRNPNTFYSSHHPRALINCLFTIIENALDQDQPDPVPDNNHDPNENLAQIGANNGHVLHENNSNPDSDNDDDPNEAIDPYESDNEHPGYAIQFDIDSHDDDQPHSDDDVQLDQIRLEHLELDVEYQDQLNQADAADPIVPEPEHFSSDLKITIGSPIDAAHFHAPGLYLGCIFFYLPMDPPSFPPDVTARIQALYPREMRDVFPRFVQVGRLLPRRVADPSSLATVATVRTLFRYGIRLDAASYVLRVPFQIEDLPQIYPMLAIPSNLPFLDLAVLAANDADALLGDYMRSTSMAARIRRRIPDFLSLLEQSLPLVVFVPLPLIVDISQGRSLLTERSLMEMAMSRSSPQVLQYLAYALLKSQHGAVVFQNEHFPRLCQDRPQQALDLLRSACSHNAVDIFEHLLTMDVIGDLINMPMDDGNTLVHYSFMTGRFQVAACLIQSRSWDPFVANAAGRLAFSYIPWCQSLSFYDALERLYGADPQQYTAAIGAAIAANQRQLLFYWSRMPHFSQALVDHRCRQGRTILDYTLVYKRSMILACLAGPHQLRWNQPSATGRSPIGFLLRHPLFCLKFFICYSILQSSTSIVQKCRNLALAVRSRLRFVWST